MAGFVKIKDIMESGKARSSNISAENLTNLYYEKNDEQAKNGGNSIYGTPGLLLRKDLGFDTPIYAQHLFDGYEYIVTNDHMYVMNPSGTIVDLGSVGTVNQNVQLEDNGINAILLTASGAGYLATPTTLTQITDPFFNDSPPSSFCVIAQRVLWSIQDSNQFFWSELNDAATYSSLNVATAAQSPSNIVRLFRNNADIYIQKTDITEIWQLSTDANLPFIPNQGATFQQGNAAKLSTSQIKGAINWLGADLSIYSATGYEFRKISTVDIDTELSKLNIINDAFGVSHAQGGHWFYIITFPSEDITIAYDFTTQKWHIRKSYGIGRWRINTLSVAFGKILVGDYQYSRIYELDLDVYTDNGITIERIAVTPPLFNEGNRFFLYAVELDIEGGVGTLDGQGMNPQCMLKVSDDGNHTFSNELWEPIGAMGAYKTVVRWSQLGFGYNISMTFTITDPIKVAIAGIYAIIKAGVK